MLWGNQIQSKDSCGIQLNFVRKRDILMSFSLIHRWVESTVVILLKYFHDLSQLCFIVYHQLRTTFTCQVMSNITTSCPVIVSNSYLYCERHKYGITFTSSPTPQISLGLEPQETSILLQCTKFCSDHCILIEMIVKRSFHRIWIAMGEPLVKRGPGPKYIGLFTSCSRNTNINVLVNSLRPRQNGHYFADDIFKCIFLNENFRVSNKI